MEARTSAARNCQTRRRRRKKLVMRTSAFSRASQFLLALALIANTGCTSDPAEPLEQKKVRVDSVEPACAVSGSSAGYIAGNGFGALNVTVTVGGMEAEVLTATGHDASFVVPEGLPPGPTQVVVTNPGGKVGTIDWVICDPQTQADLTVSGFELVRTEPATPTTFDFIYTAVLLNSRDVPVRAAQAIVSTSDPQASVPDDELEFGFVPAGESARSTGTFTIRQDGTSSFDPSALSFVLTTPPAFEPPVARGVELGSTEVIELRASDPEDDPLSFRAEAMPDGVTLDSSTGTLTVVATGEPRSFPLAVDVSDGVFEDSTVIDIAMYAAGVASPPEPPPDLSIPPEVATSLPSTTDGKVVLSVSTETGNPDAPTVALVYDPAADGPVARFGACLSRVVACARTNSIGTFPGCVPLIERCADDTGGMDCCAPSCIDAFIALEGAGVPVMQAINESFLDGQCQEGLR